MTEIDDINPIESPANGEPEKIPHPGEMRIAGQPQFNPAIPPGLPQIEAKPIDPDTDILAIDLVRQVVKGAEANQAIALMIANKANDEILTAAIVQMVDPMWRMSSNWLTQLTREGKVIAVCWMARVFIQGREHGRVGG